MCALPSQNGNFTVKKNNIIFHEGQDVQSVNILLQGKTDVFLSTLDKYDGMNKEEILDKSLRIFNIEQNIFIGSEAIFSSGKYPFSYLAAEHSTLYAFPAGSTPQVEDMLQTQKDYGAYIVSSLSTLVNCSCEALVQLDGILKSLYIITDNLSAFFWGFKEKYNFSGTPSKSFFRDGLANLEKLMNHGFQFPSVLNSTYLEKDFSDIFETEYSIESSINSEKLLYYQRLSNLSVELRKAFFGEDVYITSYHCKDAAELLEGVISSLKTAFQTADQLFRRLYCEGEECLFTEYVKAAVDVGRVGGDATSILLIIDLMVKKIKETVTLYRDRYEYSLEIDMEYLNSLHNQAKSAGSVSSNLNSRIEISDRTDHIPEELRDSTRKILEYSGISTDRARTFLANLEAFRSLGDRFRFDNDASSIRKNVTSVFFEIYEAVFKRVMEEKNESRLYHMFLEYAYMDENLLNPEHALALYKLADKSVSHGFCQVYNIREWLGDIYSMEKDPSISEFGQDYFDVFREMKKRKEVTDKDKAGYDNNANGRLHFEISNMFKINQKLCHGQISVYFPILHNEMISKDLAKAFVTADRVKESINKILEADFSAFHREVFYANPDKGIEKELIMKAFAPDIILMPTFGTRAIMWQELTGRNRSSSGRFILPIFTCENLDDLLTKIVGNFRWELCRTMLGVAWNDISQKSLTSEYTDYIQFYKKNKDLTEDARNKVKTQIQKHRNALRDIFTSDYETWIHSEAKGIRRLNKVSRNILYRNCPFSKSIRETIGTQPMYSDVSAQFNNLRSKQAKELENRYLKFTKSGTPLDSELEDNLKFFKEM